MGSAEPINRIEENIIIERVTAASIAVPVISESKRPKIKRAAKHLIVAEAEKYLTTREVIEIEVDLGSETFKWPVNVAPIGDKMSLGCDLIDGMDITINSKRGLQTNGQMIGCDTKRN
ncbi:Hypothetical predicted protein [Mytilus galloprovincialis]|uniref:Uncharacterized protein n=1 Tax=Mytilus galloprovincialis TaxID=29158 RepID=A0A8B6D1X5_MYTGA|nr:Hypothetical predicted protein [Mytilus galloprovincialis]